MCRLFGLMANKEVDVEFSFLRADRPFKNLSTQNPDGWGVGYHEKGKAEIFKEPISANESSTFLQKAKDVQSKSLISHVRSSTQGNNEIKNTHPFNYKNWIFAHNGNIDIKSQLKEEILPEYRNHIIGETDSEAFFIWLVQNIDKNGIIEGIKKAIKIIESRKGQNTSSLNFLLTDGNAMYALRKAYYNIDYYSLFYLIRDPQKTNESDFRSNETKQLIHSKRLREEKAVIVCSEKLTTDENWTLIDNNTLVIIDKNLKLSKLGV